ncbi:MAG TPA: 50S ribosomal protein L29 [Anaerolineales bacterium]|nr:50S ribosomal protein L29 [Anaerolineales bacterium]
MKSQEIRNLTTQDIRTRLNDAREELMRLRFQQAMGGLTDFTRLRYTRRNIARFMTILNERERSESQEGEA